MPDDEKELLRLALENSLAAKAAWQSIAAVAAHKGPVTKRLVLDALFAAQTKLDFEATVHLGSPAGDVAGRARDQIRQFRDSLADVAPSPPLLHKTPGSEPSAASGPDREAAQGKDR